MDIIDEADCDEVLYLSITISARLLYLICRKKYAKNLTVDIPTYLLRLMSNFICFGAE